MIIFAKAVPVYLAGSHLQRTGETMAPSFIVRTKNCCRVQDPWAGAVLMTILVNFMNYSKYFSDRYSAIDHPQKALEFKAKKK